MRSLPICKAFLNPFASSCKGSSTLGFVRLETESDWRRPLRVGVRQELVRVSVRAVDIFAGRPRPRRRASADLGLWHTALGSQLAEGVEWLGSRLRLAVDRARRLCFAWASRRLASSPESAFWASSLVCLCVDRRPASQPSPQPVAADPSLDDPCGREATKPATLQRHKQRAGGRRSGGFRCG